MIVHYLPNMYFNPCSREGSDLSPLAPPPSSSTKNAGSLASCISPCEIACFLFSDYSCTSYFPPVRPCIVSYSPHRFHLLVVWFWPLSIILLRLVVRAFLPSDGEIKVSLTSTLSFLHTKRAMHCYIVLCNLNY